jgi:uncharacterized membrane protein
MKIIRKIESKIIDKTMGWISSLFSWLKEKQLNLSNEKEVDDLKQGEERLNNGEKQLNSSVDKNKEKDLKSREAALNSRKKALWKLRWFRLRIHLKQLFLLIPILLFVIVIILIAVILIGFVPDVVESSIVAASNFIQSIFGIISNFNKEIRIIISILILILLLLVGCGFYFVVKSFRRYQNALNKLNLLIMQLKLYTDKDLLISSRLDRELEIIYRILES